MATITINGATLKYTDIGSGPPLVMVHGSSSGIRTWSQQQPVFSNTFRTITYSRRYHWTNLPIDEGQEYSMQEHLNDLQQILLILDATPANLIRHSYGGFLCLLLALQHPHLIHTLTLAEPPVITLFVSNSLTRMEIFKVFLTNPRTVLAILEFGAKGLPPAKKAFLCGNDAAGVRVFGNNTLGSHGYDNLPASGKKQVLDNLSTVNAELLGPGFLPLRLEQLTNLSVPTLLLSGAKSSRLLQHITRYLGRSIPGAYLVTIPAATHRMHEDNPDFFKTIVQSFIEEHSTTT